jgi:hypothetical protein
MGPPPIDRQRPRRGCLGCFVHLLGILIVGLILGGTVYVGMVKVFYPWAFYFGGHAHLLPMWEGVGRMHTEKGDYTLTLYLGPARGGRTFNLPTVKGTGYLCTPRKDRFNLFVYGGLSEKTGTDMNGKTMSLRYYRHPFFGGISGDYEQPPRLEFRGVWRNPDLVMDDGGSLAAAFLPDGPVSPHPYKWYHADAKNKVPIVFHEVSIWQRFDEKCEAK